TEKKRLDMAVPQGEIRAVAFSPTGNAVAAGTTTGRIHMWNPANGALVRTLAGPKGSIWSIAFSPDGKTVASSSGDGTVRIWNVGTGKEMRTLEAPGAQVLASSALAIAWTTIDRAIHIFSEAGGLVTLRAMAGHEAGYVLAAGSVELLGKEPEAATEDLG